MTATLTRVTPMGVLVMSAEQIRDRDRWLAARRQGIGSSDVPAILDLDDAYVTAAHVWHDKLGHDVDQDSEPALWGRIMEAPIAEEWCRRNRSVIEDMGLIAHRDNPIHMASLDRRVRECPLDRSHRIECGLEVKQRSAFKAHRWHRDAPDDVLAQCMWQMIVSGFRHMHYAVLIGGNDYRQGVIWWDDDIAAYILGQVERFWTVNVLGRVEPPWNTAKADRLIELDERLHPDRVGEIDVSGIGEVIDYARVAKIKNDAEKERKTAAARLRELAAGHHHVKFAGELAYSVDERHRSDCDLDLLAEHYPDAYAACVSESTYHQITIAKPYKAGDPS